MLFHTWTFLCFFVIVLGGFHALRKTSLWVHWLLLASYVFYGWWNPYYLGLILYSTALDFLAVQMMDRSNARRRLWLWISIINNLSLLFFFKYAGFFISNLNGLPGLNLPQPENLMPFGLEYLLPVGISFYTFQSMSYTIDFYRGEIEREKSFVRFATFVSFFPQLVAGPIERARNLLPQFLRAPKVTREDFADGLSLFVLGLFKKLALANYLALYVERVYGAPGDFGGGALALATFAFAWQIYFDFSGYTDMARGVARMMGFRLMLNFNNPYLAVSLGDFWSRWHISLSTWFRDYVYIPLGGNRKGGRRMYANLLATFIISGLWHGAAWTFLVWGMLHGLGLVATRQLERSTWFRDRLPRFVKQIGVFLFVCFAWIFFRAESMSDAGLIISRIFSSAWTDPQIPLLMLVLVGATWACQFLQESRWRSLLQPAWVRVGLVVGMLLYICLCSSGGGEFIYFQF